MFGKIYLDLGNSGSSNLSYPLRFLPEIHRTFKGRNCEQNSTWRCIFMEVGETGPLLPSDSYRSLDPKTLGSLSGYRLKSWRSPEKGTDTAEVAELKRAAWFPFSWVSGSPSPASQRSLFLATLTQEPSKAVQKQSTAAKSLYPLSKRKRKRVLICIKKAGKVILLLSSAQRILMLSRVLREQSTAMTRTDTSCWEGQGDPEFSDTTGRRAKGLSSFRDECAGSVVNVQASLWDRLLALKLSDQISWFPESLRLFSEQS